MATTPTCPQCKSTALTLFAQGTVVFDGQEWTFEGEFIGKRWLSCSDCGRTWTTKRDIHATAQALRPTYEEAG